VFLQRFQQRAFLRPLAPKQIGGDEPGLAMAAALCSREPAGAATDASVAQELPDRKFELRLCAA